MLNGDWKRNWRKFKLGSSKWAGAIKRNICKGASFDWQASAKIGGKKEKNWLGGSNPSAHFASENDEVGMGVWALMENNRHC